MTPNLMKSQTDTSKFAGNGPASTEDNPNKNPVTEYNPAAKVRVCLRSTASLLAV